MDKWEDKWQRLGVLILTASTKVSWCSQKRTDIAEMVNIRYLRNAGEGTNIPTGELGDVGQKSWDS